jgi:hypothetical protein
MISVSTVQRPAERLQIESIVLSSFFLAFPYFRGSCVVEIVVMKEKDLRVEGKEGGRRESDR